MYYINRYSIYDLKYGLCCIPIVEITSDMAKELIKIIDDIGRTIGLFIDKITVEKFLVHIIFSCQINAPSLLSIINIIKGVSSRKLRQKFPELRQVDKLWLKGYYIISLGENSEGRLNRALNRLRRNIVS